MTVSASLCEIYTLFNAIYIYIKVLDNKSLCFTGISCCQRS